MNVGRLRMCQATRTDSRPELRQKSDGMLGDAASTVKRNRPQKIGDRTREQWNRADFAEGSLLSSHHERAPHERGRPDVYLV